MIKKNLKSYCATFVAARSIIPMVVYSFFCPGSSHADTMQAFQHPFYVGAIAGAGSTTWEGLVPSHENQNMAINISTP
ncbi:MAG: hypothetical protein ACHP65_08950, partial [Legionellales bacterium]